MGTQGVDIELAPAELLRRLPRGAGTFLLDGGGRESWGDGHALLGCGPSTVVAVDTRGSARVVAGRVATPLPRHSLDLLQHLVDGASEADDDVPAGGVLCALGYDLGRWIERIGPIPPDDLRLPVLLAAVHPWVLSYSYHERRYTLRSRMLPPSELERVRRRLEWMARQQPAGSASQERAILHSNLTEEGYGRLVERALAYIAAGDIYQVNLAQRFAAAIAVSPTALFADWIRQHPVPYAAYVDGGPWALVSNSPECFLRCRDRRVETFPIKGTRARAAAPVADQRLAAELSASVKDRAEHVMIVDLERNDLGRVCEIGSVTVPEMAGLRSYPSVHHLESCVAGTRRTDVRIADVLRALFPGGSITGAPKIRAMQIIDELEPVARGFYTGAIGFIAGDRWAHFNIAIRTAVVTGAGVTYHAGGGIVADSSPHDEYRETLVKTRSFAEALAGIDPGVERVA